MKILLFGDSHTVGSYGAELESLFRSAGFDVVRLAKGGASAVSFSSIASHRTVLEEALARGPYDVAIVTLGTNDASNSGAVPIERSAAAIRDLADQLPAETVFWVGPPAFSPAIASSLYPSFATDDLNARSQRLWRLASPLFPARAIDPREATLPYVRNDDVHFGVAGGRAWAAFVGESVRTALREVPETPPTPASASLAVLDWKPWAISGIVALGLLTAWRLSRR